MPDIRPPLPALRFELAPKAFQLFRAWTAAVKYDRPTFAPLIEDERLLVYDLEDALLQGLEDLSQSPQAHRKSTRWAAGYLGGFALARLNRLWYRKHLLPLQPDYQQAMWLKAMITHMDQHPEGREAVNYLYERLLRVQFPFAPDQRPPQEDAPDWDPSQERVLADLHAQAHWQRHRHPLDELVEQYFDQALQRERKAYLSEAARFFTRQELTELVLNNPYEQ